MVIALGPFTFDTQGGADALAFTWTDPLGTGLQPANTARRWCHETNDTTSSNIGPTSGAGGSPDGYAYTEASSPAVANDVFYMELNTILDCENNTNVTVRWKTNQRGNDNNATCQLQSNEASAGWVNRGILFGGSGDPNKVETSGAQIWAQRSIDISALGVNNASTKVRLVITFPSSGTIWNNDYGIDEFEVITLVLYKLEGITKDKNGDILASCEVALFKSDTATPPAYIYQAKTTSNGVTGVYSFTGLLDNDARYMIYSIKDNTPNVFDATDNVLQPEVE